MPSITKPNADVAAELLRQARDAIVLVDTGGCIVYANDRARAVFGYGPGELEGQAVELLVPESFRESHVRLRRPKDGVTHDRPFLNGLSLQGRRKCGEVFDAEIALTTISTDDGPLICSTVRDLTDKESANTYFRNLLESAPDAIIVVNREGSIEIVNRQCESMFGYSRGELIGLSVDNLLPPDLRGRHAGHRAGYFDDPHIRPMGRGLDLRGRRKDGSEFPVEISLSPVTSPNGLRVSSVIRDVTESKRLENDLIEARQEAERANRANTAFLTAASHDLRQPVQALSLLNGALRRTVDNPLAKEMVESQQQSLDAMTNLLNSLLDISRLDRGIIEPEIEEFPIRRLVDRLSAEFARQASHKGLEFSSCDSKGVVRSDPNLLGEIIQNLVSNAIRYTEPGGTVSLRCTRDNGRLRVAVHDTGVGIEAGELDRIFNEFHQVKRPGANNEGFGLGLAIVRRLADLLGVSIEVESEPGQGSCFSVLIPSDGRAQPRAEDEVAEHAAARTDHGARVILVEDDPSVARAWALLLRAEGFEVHTAASVSQVRALVAGLAAPPDLVISDYHLVDGSTGVEAVRVVRTAFDSEIPAFIVSGDTSKVVDKARLVSNSILMRKPVNTEVLLGMARSAVETGVIEEN